MFDIARLDPTEDANHRDNFIREGPPSRLTAADFERKYPFGLGFLVSKSIKTRINAAGAEC